MLHQSKYICLLTLSLVLFDQANYITLGGNITNESYEFIQDLTSKGLDSYETRKCTFKTNKVLSKNKFQDFLTKALEFEFKWLNYKKSFYSNRSKFDESRINIIKSRIKL